jgi:hypothetical protein
LWIRIRNTGLLTLSQLKMVLNFFSSSLLSSLHALIFSAGKVSSSHWAVFFEGTEPADRRGKHLVGKIERKTAKLSTLTVAYKSSCYLFYVLHLIQDEEDEEDPTVKPSHRLLIKVPGFRIRIPTMDPQYFSKL